MPPKPESAPARQSKAGSKPAAPRRGRSRKKPAPSIPVADAIRLMTDQYGPFPEEPRLDPIHELTFTILSQHTSDTNSERAFRSLMQRFGSLDAVAAGDVSEIEEAISGGGLAKIKAPRIKQVLSRIIELNGSLDLSFLREMPLSEAKAWLRQLPGIGPKSAGIILSFSLGMPAMAIDTHIYRVSQRLALIGPKVSADKAHDLLEEAVDPEMVYPFHQAFITHGRQVCKAQRPRCEECVVSHGCPSGEAFMAAAAKPAKSEGKSGNRKKSTTTKATKRQRTAAQAPHAYPSSEGEGAS